MGYVALLLIVLIAAGVSKADGPQGGAKKRAHIAREPQTSIEDIIRAEEDPNFMQYLKEREHQKAEERKALLEYKKQRLAEEDAEKRAERKFLEEEREKETRQALAKPKRPVNETTLWQQQQEKYRREFVADQQKRVEKDRSEQVARVQQLMSIQRMPASDK